jgi:phenylalanyl-tRNA synthetase alpha chain
MAGRKKVPSSDLAINLQSHPTYQHSLAHNINLEKNNIPLNPEFDSLILALHDYERILLDIFVEFSERKSPLTLDSLNKHIELELDSLLCTRNFDSVMASRAYQWLSNKNIILVSYHKYQVVSLGVNGQTYAKKSLPEIRMITELQNAKRLAQSQLLNLGFNQQEIGVCLGLFKKLGLATVSKSESGEVTLEISLAGKSFSPQTYLQQQFLELSFPLQLDSLTESQKQVLEELKKRQDIVILETKQEPKISLTDFGFKLLQYYAKKLESGALVQYKNSLTKEDIRQYALIAKQTVQQFHQPHLPLQQNVTSSHMQTPSFVLRPFDVTSRVPSVFAGRIHPMTAIMRMIRDIFVEMGFSEMQGPWVETAFWCMDSMWIPQDHPARDVQDTFYLNQIGLLPNAKLVSQIKDVHETGGKSGSKGYSYIWNPQKAAELILRTHTTATTFRTLAKVGNNEGKPLKKFYIGKVFRNEAIDATHLPEFYQVEGFIMGEGLHLGHLLGVIKEFYAKLGFTNIKFKPTYNPYTEPSIEAYYYDERRKKWMELINSGIFRPESLAPYGITQPVIAWGLGLERLAMLMLEQNKLKDIIGTSTDLKWMRTYKVPRRNELKSSLNASQNNHADFEVQN